MTQAKFEFISDAAGGDQFTVVSFSGHEAISTLYQYQIEIRAPLSAAISLDDVLDSPARFITELDDKEYPVHGILSNFEELQTTQDYVHFKAVLVPRLWGLSIYKTNEIYTQEKTVDKIIGTVLENAELYEGADYDLSGLVKTDLLERDYVCQFGESDFDFISRLMENEGIFYYFDHSSGDAEKIIFINDMNYEAINRPALTFDVTPSTNKQHDCIDAWSCRKQRLAGAVTVRDFNPDHPSVDISDTSPIDSMSLGTDYIYGENIQDEDEASYLSEIRAEQSLCNKTRYYGEGSVIRLQAGYLFEMDMHPNENYNGMEYLAVEVNHEGQHLDMQMSSGATQAQPQYRNSFVAIDAGEQFRPSRKMPKPRFYGTMTAFIYAEAATMKAEIDEYGRYRVHLPFDRSDGTLLSTDPDRKASTWIRMAQPFVGQEQGMYYPLAGGTEVLLTFINGDPDQPIISGAVPNASQPSLLTSETNFQRSITTQPVQTISGNTHSISRNSARLAAADEPPLAPHPTGMKPKPDKHTSLSAYATDGGTPEIALPVYINEDENQDSTSPSISMIPPWEGYPLDTVEPAAFDENLVKFKLYDKDLNAWTMNPDDIINEDDDLADSLAQAALELVSTDRSGGDEYVYANRRTFAYPQHERVYFIGTFHEDFHVKDGFMNPAQSWTGVCEQFSFPAPGGKYPDGMSGETHTDKQVNSSGIRGVSEDKRWGDQMNYAWGRSFNWAGGPCMPTTKNANGEPHLDSDNQPTEVGHSFGVYNYGNSYEEKLATEKGGTSEDPDFALKDLKDQMVYDEQNGWSPADDVFGSYSGWPGYAAKALGWFNGAVKWVVDYVDVVVHARDLPGDVGYFEGVAQGLSGTATGDELFDKTYVRPFNNAFGKGRHVGTEDLREARRLFPGDTIAEKVFGNTYSYQAGLAVDIHEGHSIGRTYGDSEEIVTGDANTVVHGDSYETTVGNAHNFTIGFTHDTKLSNESSIHVGATEEFFLGGEVSLHVAGQAEFAFAGKFEFFLGAQKGVCFGPNTQLATEDFKYKNLSQDLAVTDLSDSISKIENHLNKISSGTAKLERKSFKIDTSDFNSKG